MISSKYVQYLDKYLKTKPLSIAKFCKEECIDRGRFASYLKKSGIIIINHQNKLKFNNTIFDNIDTEEKSYWLGFLFADGYVSNSRNQVEFTLKLSDIEHVKKFSKFLNCELPIRSDSYRARCIVTDKHLKEKLIKYGCVPNKSLVLQFPNLSQKMIQHFIRGYFDGDGSFYKRKPKDCKREHLVFSLLGTKEFLLKCCQYIDCKPSLYKKNSTISNNYFIIAANNRSLNVGQYLYQNATIYLQRKYDVYNKIAVLNRNI